MNPRKQIFGTVVRPAGDDDDFELLPGTLATNLILFNKLIINSPLLREIPLIVRQFGLGPTIELLNSGAVEIHCEATQIMNMGSTEEAVKNDTLYKLHPQLIVDHDHRESTRRWTSDIQERLHLPINDFIRLRAAVVTHLDVGIRADDKRSRPEFKAAKGLVSALEANTPILKGAIARHLEAIGGTPPPPDSYRLIMHRQDGDSFDVETDLAEVAHIDDAAAHDAIQQGVLSLGGLRSLLEYMAHYEAIGTIAHDDIELLSDDLQLFANRLSDNRVKHEFSRVINVSGFPSLGRLARSGDLRLDKILELRETSEILEFRDWLPTMADVSNDELRDRLDSFSNHVGSFLRSKPGKGLRWLVTKGIGEVNPAVGVAASLANTFLIEKLLPVSGPISFINQNLSTVFELDTPARRAGLILLDLKD